MPQIPCKFWCGECVETRSGTAACLTPVDTTQQIVVGGAINGQVLAWDITKSLSTIDQRKREKCVRHLAKHGGAGGDGDDEESVVSLPPIKPLAMSHIDMSHRRVVADLAWFPPTTQVGEGGRLVALGRTELICSDFSNFSDFSVETGHGRPGSGGGMRMETNGCAACAGCIHDLSGETQMLALTLGDVLTSWREGPLTSPLQRSRFNRTPQGFDSSEETERLGQSHGTNDARFARLECL